jgi:hypothetical protein
MERLMKRCALVFRPRTARHGWVPVIVGLVFVSACTRSHTSSAFHFDRDFAATVSAETAATDQLRQQARTAVEGGVPELLPVYESMLQTARDSIGRYRHLHPPSRRADAFHRLVGSTRTQVRILERALDEARAGDADRLANTLRELADVVAERTSALQELSRTPDAPTPK